MNRAFTNKKRINLDEHWYLIPDSDNGVILVFNEKRQRKIKNSEVLEDYIFEEPYYYTCVVSALKHFVDITQNKSKTLEELISKVDYNTELLEKLNEDFMQFN